MMLSSRNPRVHPTVRLNTTGEQITVTSDYLAKFHPTPIYWTDPRIKRIIRLRLLSDPGFPFWDVSYCWGEMKDGTPCFVSLPFDQLPKRNMRGAIIKYAREDHIHAKSLGIFDNISTLQ